LRVFLDSNVLFSGICAKGGPPAQIIDLHSTNELRIVICQLVLDEVVRTLRLKKPGNLPAIYKLLTNSPPEIIVNPPLQAIKPYERYLSFGDATILAAAVHAEAGYLVTGDKHFYEDNTLSGVAGIKIVTPAQFIQSLSQ